MYIYIYPSTHVYTYVTMFYFFGTLSPCTCSLDPPERKEYGLPQHHRGLRLWDVQSILPLGSLAERAPGTAKG